MDWASVIAALIGAGALTYLDRTVRAWRRRRAALTPAGQEAAHLAAADQAITVVARARDELAEDNRRLRIIIAEERRRHADDRAQWTHDKAAMRAEIVALEAKLRAVLAEVEAFKRRHPEDV